MPVIDFLMHQIDLTPKDLDRIVVAEGFVFAPDEKKKPIMRQLEAALQTLVRDAAK